MFIYDFETFKKSPAVIINEINRFVSGKDYTGRISRSKRSNSGVPLSLESLLRKCNKMLGNKMSIKVFGKVLSQRTILQTHIPRIYNFKKKRDLTDIIDHYKSDYTKTKKMISELNPTLYKKIEENHFSI